MQELGGLLFKVREYMARGQRDMGLRIHTTSSCRCHPTDSNDDILREILLAVSLPFE